MPSSLNMHLAFFIMLYRTIIELSGPEMASLSGASIFFIGVGRFCLMFFASSAIGVAFGLVSSMVSFVYA